MIPTKQYVPSFFFLLLFLKIMDIPIICLQYQLNKDFIAANLCENRDRPEMHCQGKCHLNKTIEKNSESDHSPSNKSAGKIPLLDFFQEHYKLIFELQKSLHQKFESYLNHYTHTYSAVIFHPPLFS